jgi:uncharacterized repeat protein (TIGR01451 family)
MTAQRIAARTCTDVNTADFTGRTVGEDWKTSRTLTVEGTTITSSAYGTNPATTTTALSVEDVVYGRVLYWTADYATNGTLAPGNTSANRSTVTFTLNRSTTGFAITLNDIDKTVGTANGSGWTDLVQVDGYATAGSTTPITLTAADVTLGTNGSNAWNGSNQVIGTGNNTTTEGNVTVLFPSAVTKVVVTYKNAQTTYADPGSQIIGIAGFSYCALADAYTTIAAPASLSAGIQSGNYTATFGNNAGRDNAATTTRVVTIPANTASAVTATGGTVAGSQAGGWTITYPAGSGVVAGTSTSYNFRLTPLAVASIAVTSTTSTTTDQSATGNDQATVTTNVTPVADLTTTLTGPGALTANVTSGNYTVTYTNNGPSPAVSTTRTVTIPSNGNITAVTPSAGSVSGSAGTSWVITFPAGANIPAGGSVSYTFTVRPSGSATNNTVTATSNTGPGSGGTGQGNNTAPDAASVSYTVGSAADISAAFTSGQANNSTVLPGTTVSYGVTFTNAGPGTASNVTRTVDIPAGVPSVTAATGTVTGDQDNGWTITYPGGTIAAGNSNAYSFSIVAPATGPVTLTASTTATSSQGLNTLSDTGTRTLNVTPVVLSGTIFDDVNYGGGAGRSYATANSAAVASGFTSNAIQRPGATVELYDASGNYVATTASNAAGLYSFSVPVAGNYTVRVVTETVTPMRAASTTGLLGVQTYVYNDGNRVGGEAPALLDADENTTGATLGSLTAGTGAAATTPQSIKAVTVPTGGLTGVDFGYNFDLITNTRDAGPGSLRQFILNSNALVNTNLAQAGQTAGAETSIFMISNGSTSAVPAGLRSGVSGGAAANGVATIELASALPNITGANAGATTLTGLTQSVLYGNQSQPVAEQTTGPEVIVDFNGANGFNLAAATPRVIGLGFTGANPTGGSTTAALSVLAGATTAYLQDNTFFSNGSNLRINGVGSATITGNISRNALATNSDGIEVTSSSGNTITNNQFVSNAGYGIDFISGASANNSITGNLFKSNGQNTSDGQTAGIGIRSGTAANNTISGNVFTANVGDGISSRGGSNNVFSQNSFYANGDLGIDLTSTTSNNGDGVTLNDTDDADGTAAVANGLINFPIITAATLRNGNLIVQGYARPGATVELYAAAADPTGFGEGQTYFATFVEGTAADTDGGSGVYSGLINGLNQGTDNAYRFRVSIALSSLTTAQRSALTASGAKLTALSTLTSAVNGNQGTSEFSGTAPVLAAPVANNDVAVTLLNTPVTLTVTGNDQNDIDPSSVSLNGQAAGSTTSVAVTGGSFQFLGNGQVQFTPSAGFTGIASLPYTVSNTSGASSNPAYLTVEVRTPSVDLATLISAPSNGTTINGGSALTYTVVAGNNSVATATGVVETLQLPAGLTTNGGTVGISGGQNAASASYDNQTGVVTIPVGTMAGLTTQTYNVAVAAMPGSGPVTVTANISGAVTEPNTLDNVASTTVSINPRYDVTTSISGPAGGLVRGNEVTYTVTTSNLNTTAGSVSPAPNVVQKVQLPSGLSGVFASNGGTYDSGSGVVTFPAIGALPVGQTVVNSISFAIPTASSFTGPTATVTAGASNDNAGDINSPSAGTNNNAANLNGLATNPTVTTFSGGAAVNVYTSISSSAANVAPGASVTLTITARNAGPNAADNVNETLQLPAGLSNVTVSSGVYNGQTGLVTFNGFGTLSPAGSASATVTFNAPAQGFVLATATVTTTSSDLLPADNLAQTKVEVAPVADVTTALTGPTTVAPGQVASYTVTTSSVGEAPAVGVVQRVSLPAGLSGVAVSNGGSYDAASGIVTFTLSGPLAKGSAQVNTISYTVPTGAASFAAVANVSSTTPETVLTNNTATVVTTLQATSDLLVRVSGPATAVVGSAVTYALTTTNNGPSTAATVQPTLQLPTGLGTVVLNGGASNSGSYDPATGLVTFTAATALVNGGSLSNTATFLMPDASSVNGLARVSAASAESNLDNNFASVATTAVTPGATTTNLGTSIAASTTSPGPNAPVTVTANFSNAAGAGTATAVVPSLALPAGLSNVTVSGGTGGSYNGQTGLVTWNSPGNLAGGAALPTDTYKVSFNAPTSGPVTATVFITSSTPETDLSNNAVSTTLTVAPSADVATGVSGPSTTLPGATVTYAVTTLNNGVSPASTTQTVRIPDSATNIVTPAGSTQSAAAGGFITITFPAISLQPVGVAGQVTNYVTFTAPGAAYTVNAVLTPGTSTGDVTGNNSATVGTSINRAPVAYNVVNSLQTPEANTAGSLLISPLVATDADNNTLTYTITSVPATGTLYLGSTQLFVGSTVAAGLINTLRYDPAAGFIGNAFFGYTATDNAASPATSNPAIYTIPVGQDVSSVYTAAPTKGGSLATAYQNGDLIASVIDVNGARYNGSGLMYDAAVANGTLVSGANNGVTTASTDAAGTSLLTTLGLTLSSNGEIRVTDRTKLNLRAGSYSLNVTTVDANGGTNAQVVSFTIGCGPLPVVLTEFTAKGQNSDALLSWKTAQEKNNDHFEVERSLDGVRFEKVGVVAGHGTVSTAQQYSYLDAGAARLAGTVYYRLKQVDFDGTIALTEVRAVSFKQTGVELALYPNPARETLHVRLSGQTGPSTVTVYNTAGALVLQGQLDGALRSSFDVRNLPAGTYLVKVQAANGQPLIRRFVKN